MDPKTIATLAVTLLVAASGYVVKYLHDLGLARRKERLDRVDRQLRQLYGPLYALCGATEIAWVEFRKKYRPGKSFWKSLPLPDDEEAAAWRAWMSDVFMPLNIEMERVIIQNADLIDDPGMPECFLTLCAHVSGYKPVMSAWKAGDFSLNFSVVNFPKIVLSEHVWEKYHQLKRLQAELMHPRSLRRRPAPVPRHQPRPDPESTPELASAAGSVPALAIVGDDYTLSAFADKRR